VSLYELAVLGHPTDDERRVLRNTIGELVGEFDLALDDQVSIRDSTTLGERDERAALAACYFARPGPNDQAEFDAAAEVLRATAPIIPTVGPTQGFADVPEALRGSNGLRRRADDGNHTELAAALLECVGLLRVQRRVFVSYRRAESRSAAIQLHDLLSARGFNVFLDTHDIRPGELFQETLWHRLCDSDVVVMLDTPNYFESKWTSQEVSRALSKGILVLRVVWPGHTPSKFTDLADTVYLSAAELVAPDGPIAEEAASRIALTLERLRSRSLAARHRSMTGCLRVEAQKVGCHVEGVGAHRACAIRLLNGQRIWAYPVIGVPTADLLHDIADKAARAGHANGTVLVYDNVGISVRWANHLVWLETKIAEVRWIKISEAGWALAGLIE
jgi:TIR domain-containing protein